MQISNQLDTIYLYINLCKWFSVSTENSTVGRFYLVLNFVTMESGLFVYVGKVHWVIKGGAIYPSFPPPLPLSPTLSQPHF